MNGKTHHTLTCECCNGGCVDVTLDGDAWEAVCENCGPRLAMHAHVLEALRYADRRIAEALAARQGVVRAGDRG